MPRYGDIDQDYAVRLASAPAGAGPIYMLNLMAYREEADYGPGGERGVSGREADDRYAPFVVLQEIGATICFVADVVESSEPWDRVAVVRYPDRRSFIEMNSRADFQAKHVHKEAGMDHTIVMGTVPVAGLPHFDDGRLLLLEVWDGEPPPAVPGRCAAFDVEGTIVGDGRRWAGARYISVDAPPPVAAATRSQQMLVLRPMLQQWS